jgi:hypothetical protein
MIDIEMEDIYVFTGISRRGEPILVSRHQDTMGSTKAYVYEYYIPGSWLMGGRIVIKYVRDIPLGSILFYITKLAGSTSDHFSSKPQISYTIQCLEPRLFNWSVGFSRNVKEQISKCRTSRKKQLGYSSFMVSFFLERIPHIQP